MNYAWLYLIMIAAGIVLFYYANESMILDNGDFKPTQTLWFINISSLGLLFFGFLLGKHECEKVLIKRHKM